VSGDVDTLLASHHRLVGPRRDIAGLPSNQHVIETSSTDRQSTVLVRADGEILDPTWTVTPVSLDDLVLAYLRQARQRRTSATRTLEVAR
jgi:ABC-2 type transport system ATP-binding protein